MKITVNDNYKTQSTLSEIYFFVGANSIKFDDHKMLYKKSKSGPGFSQIERFTLQRDKRC